ncbi:MAG: Na+/H+ antiporter subunit C [Balneolales bacterium]
METLLAFIVGVLFASSIFLMLRKNLIRIVIGLIMLSNAVNLLIFTMGRITAAHPPLIGEDATIGSAGMANPLPQALVLTAIVIGFGLLAFALVLAYRTYKELNTIDVDEMRIAEPPYPGEPTGPSKGSVRSKPEMVPSAGGEPVNQPDNKGAGA